MKKIIITLALLLIFSPLAKAESTFKDAIDKRRLLVEKHATDSVIASLQDKIAEKRREANTVAVAKKSTKQSLPKSGASSLFLIPLSAGLALLKRKK